MFRFVEDISVADIAFEAIGSDLAELLRGCGRAVTATMVKELDSVQPTQQKKFTIEGQDPEQLVHRFLQEVVYLKDAEKLLLSQFDAELTEGPPLRARVVAKGEPLDPQRHEQVVDVKAVTWHRFRVERTPQGWRCFAVLDI
jgi:SHS2 domain-containing protein